MWATRVTFHNAAVHADHGRVPRKKEKLHERKRSPQSRGNMATTSAKSTKTEVFLAASQPRTVGRARSARSRQLPCCRTRSARPSKSRPRREFDGTRRTRIQSHRVNAWLETYARRQKLCTHSGASRSRQMIDTNHRVRVVMLYADSIGSYKQRRLRIYSTPVRGHLSRISLSSTAMPGVMVFVDSPTCASNLRKVEAAYTGRPKGLSSRAGESAENPSRHSKSAPCQERDFL